MRRLFLVLVPLLASAIAGPIIYTDQDTCSSTCTENSNFAYLRGQTYEYSYVSDVRTSIQGASEDQSTLHLTATVLLEIHSKCEQSLRLRNVRLTEYDPSTKTMVNAPSEFAAGLEQNSVRLSYQDGTIEHVCLTNSEPTWVMNVKRGVISLLQHRMKDLQKNETVSETDISGVCDTKYSVQKSGSNAVTILKTKDLLACTDRHGYNTAIQGVPYSADSDIQSLPLLRSDHSCQHEIDTRNRHMKTATCQEQHMFRPFSNSDSGVVTVNTQSLSFVGKTTGTKSPSPITDRVSLKFEHANDLDTEDQIRKDITRKLKEICEQTKSGVRPETPRLFTDLVYMMRSADKDTLSDVYRTLNEGSLCSDNKYTTSKFFLDALPMAGTSASVNMMTDLITQRVVTGSEADMWITTLNFIKKPTQEMLRVVKPLINMPELEDKALMSIGTLVHSYCYHNGNCESDNMVRAVVSAIVNKIAQGCKVNDDNMKSTLMALRAIGNAGYANNAVPDLESCVKNSGNPVEIRLSAIEAYRRMPCSASRSALTNILRNHSEDSELRIAAYRMLMECPSDKVLEIVRNTLARETVNQVGSYIWTHLTNLMETSDPLKQEIKTLLENEDLMKEFDLDKRKFSRNYESSIFVETVNAGAKFEGDLIWSQKSFIPRSAAVNLTVDLFGHSVNLLELGARAEGLEFFLETLFGPNGYFKKPEEKSDTQNTGLALENVNMKKIENIDKKMGVTMADLRGSMYVRVFGNELRYLNFHGLGDLLSGPQINIPELIIKLAEENDYSYSHSTMFLDSSFIIPTASGFPLNLTVNGTAMINLNIHGKMDLKRPPSLDISGRIAPSAAVDISSMMSVDAHVTKTGVKMVSTLHTRTAVQGTLTIDPSGAINAKYDFPEDRMEIIDVKSSFFTIHRSVEREQSMISDRKHTKVHCSPDKLTKVLGLQVCAELSYPNATGKNNAPYFPLTGPVSAGVYVYKRDTHTYYEMSAKSKHDSHQNIVHVLFNTPGSKTDRHMEVDFNLDKQALSVGLVLRSPWKQAFVQGDVIRNNGEYGISGKLNIDGRSPYSVLANLKIEDSGNTLTYTPTFELSAPSIKPISIQGIFSTKSFKQTDIELSVKGFTDEPVIAKMTIHNKEKLYGMQATLENGKNKQYAMDTTLAVTMDTKKAAFNPLVSIRTPTKEILALGGNFGITYGSMFDFNLALDKIVDKTVTLKGKFQSLLKKRGQVIYRTDLNFGSDPADVRLIWKVDNRNFRVIANEFDLSYDIKRFARNNIKLVSKMINQSGKTLSKGKLALNLNVKKNPEYNVKLNGELEHNFKHSQLDLEVVYGGDFKDLSKSIDVSIETNRTAGNIWKASADLKAKIKIPALDIATQIEASHSHNIDQHFNSSIAIKNKGRPYSASITLLDRSATMLDIYGNLRLSTPKQDMNIENEVKQETAPSDKYVNTLSIQMQKGEKSVIVTTYEDKKLSHAIASELNLYGLTPVKIHGEFGGSPKLIADISYEKDSKTYRGILIGFDDSVTSEVHMEIEKPDYKGCIMLRGMAPGNMYSIQADLKWGNPVEELHKTNVYAWMETPSNDKMNGSLALKTSHRTIVLNVNHQNVGDRLVSHADFEWKPNSKINVDTSLQLTGTNVFGTLYLLTPYPEIPKLTVDVAHVSDSEEYNTKANIQWDKKISVETVFKKPMNLRTFVATLDLDTPLREIKKVNVFINHKMSDSVASAAKLSWNKQFLNIDVVLQNTTKGKKVSYEGTIDVQTSWNALKKGLITFSHDNNGKKFNTVARFMQNRQEYKIDSSVTQLSSANQYDNEGELTISMPSRKVETRWNHHHGDSSIATTLSANMGSNHVSAKLRGTVQKDVSLAFLIEASSEKLGYSLMNSSLVVKPDFMDGHFSLTSNEIVLASADAIYTVHPNIFKTGVTLIVPDLSINSTIAFEAYDLQEHLINARLIFDINPDLNMNIIALQSFLKKEHLAKTSVIWTTTMPGYEQVKYTYEVLEFASNLKTIWTLNYQFDKEIKIETVMMDTYNVFDLSVVLTTTFPNLPRIEGGIFITGKLDNLQSKANLEVVPYLDRTAVSFNYDASSGISSSLNLILPLKEYRFINMEVEGNFADDLKTSEFRTKCSFGPSEPIIVTFNHAIGEKLVAACYVVSPIGSLSASLDGKLSSFNSKVAFVDNFKRNYGMELRFHNAEKLEGTATVSMYGRRDIIATLTHQGILTSFESRVELSHNRKNNFLSTVSFRASDILTMSVVGSLRTELISNADQFDTSLNIQGSRSTIIVNGDLSKNNEKTEIDFSFVADSDIDASLIIISPLFRNVKTSFSHRNQQNFLQTKADLIHGGETKFSGFAQFSNGQSKVGDIKINTFLTEDLGINTRITGTLTNFVLRTEASYGNTSSIIDLAQKLDTGLLKQRITISATGVDDITTTLSYVGGKKQIKAVAELNKGTEVHRIDVIWKNDVDLDGSVSLSSPLVKPVAGSFHIKGPLNALTTHAEFKIEDDKSEIDMNFVTKPFDAFFSFRSPYLRDVTLTANQKGSYPSYTSQAKLTVEGNEDIEIRMNIAKTDKITATLAISPMSLKNISTTVYFTDYNRGGKQTAGASFTYGNEKSSIDVSYQFDSLYFLHVSLNSPFTGPVSASLQHEGGINSFKCHADFSLGTKKSEYDIFYSSVGKYEGEIMLKSYLMPELTIGFRHTGTDNNFNSYASYKYGENKTDAQLNFNLDNHIQGTVEISLPKHSPIKMHYTHSGDIRDFSCYGEVTFGQKWEAGLRFQRNPRNQGNIFFNPPSNYMKPIKFNFSVDRSANDCILNVEYVLGSSKSNADLAFSVQDGTFEIKTYLSSRDFAAIFNASAHSFEKSLDISSHIELILSSEKTEGDFMYQKTDERAYISISFDSPFVPEIDAHLMIIGMPTNFSAEGRFTIDGDLSSCKVNSDMKTVRSIDSSVSIDTPYFQEIYLRLRHFYDNPKNMVVIVNSKIDSVVRDVVFSMDLNTIDHLKFYLTLNEPHFSINFSNNKTDGAHGGFVQQGFWEVYVGDKQFQMRSYIRSSNDFSLRYILPLKTNRYDGYIEYFHNETTTHVIITDDPQQRKTAFLLKVLPEMELLIDIDMPSIPKIYSKISLSGTPTNFFGSSSFAIDGIRKGSLELNFNVDKNLDASFKLDLPMLKGFEQLSGSLKQRSKKSLQTLSGSILRTSERLVELDLKYDLKNRLFDISISCAKSIKFFASSENELFKTNWDLRLKKVHSGHIEFNYGKDQYLLNIGVEDFTLKLDFKNQLGEMDGEIAVNIAERDIISCKVKFGNNLPSSVTGNVELTWNATMIFELDLTMKTVSGYEGSVILKTPFTKYKYSELKALHQGTWTHFKTSAEGTFVGKSVSISADVTPNKGSLNIKTPFKNVENMLLQLYQNTDDSDFKAGMNVMYATGKQLKLNIIHLNTGVTMKSVITFESPFTSAVAISANHTGTFSSDFSSVYQVQNGGDSVTGTVSMKYGLQSIICTSSLKTVFEGETSEQLFKVIHDGGLDRFKTEVSMMIMGKEIRLESSFQLDPVIEASVTLLTPYNNIRNLHAAFTHSFNPNSIFSTGALQWAEDKKISGKIDVMKNGWNHISANIELSTPFMNMELSKISVTHSHSDDDLQCKADVAFAGKDVKMAFDGTRSPLSVRLNIETPFIGFETIGFESRYVIDVSRIHKGLLNVNWNPVSKITLDGSFSVQPFDARLSLTTPFKELKMTTLSAAHKVLTNGLHEALKLVYNDRVIIDTDVNHSIFGEHKSVLAIVRTPGQMKFEIDGDFTLKCVDFDMTFDWNMEDISQNMKVVAEYDVRVNKMAKFNITGFGKMLSLDAVYNEWNSKANVAWGIKSTQRAGYEVSLGDKGGDFKIILPTRSLSLFGSHRGGNTDVDFMWNADDDPTQKVSLRSYVVQTANSIKANMTFGLPLLRKEIQLGSEFIVNRGRTIFDGRAEISYSADSRKKFVISSKLEDVSLAGGKNYSINLGVSHPYTTVGIQFNSHIGQSSTGYSSGMSLEYLTTRRQMQTFAVGGIVNKLRKSVSFEMKTPVKSISISGSAQTEDKVRVSLLNVYDNKRPLATVFSIDPATRSVDFMINFDIERPSNEFHVRANFVNSSALQAEVYHIVENRRIQDVLVTVRLNNSHLIHSRIHWRPEMIQDLEAFRSQKADEYSGRIDRSVQKMMLRTTEEFVNKFHIIWSEFGEEIGQENIARFEAALLPYFDQGQRLIVTMTEPIVQKANGILTQSRSKYSAVISSDKSFVNKPLVENMALGDVIRADMFAGLRMNVSHKFNFISGKISLTRRRLQGLASDVIVWSGEKGMQMLPKVIVAQIDNLKAGTYLESYIHTILLELDQDLQTSLIDLENFLLASIRSPVTVWDTANGEIQLEQYLPIPLKSLDAMPMLEYGQEIERLRNMIPDMAPAVRMPVVPTEWLPPFTGVATISKGQRITTFDGFAYDLDAKCTFVLTRDFHNNNFTIVLSNERDTILSLMTRSLSISVNVLGQVLDDEQEISLPATIGDLSIQESNGVIEISNGDHFTIVYDTSVDHITIKISGWYFGKVSGLLGVYDNEPSNELMTTFNKVIDDTSRFAKTWTVSASGC